MNTYREMMQGYPFWIKVRYTPFVLKEIAKGKYYASKAYIREKFYSTYEKIWDKYDWRMSPKLLDYKKHKTILKVVEEYEGKHLNTIRILLSNTWDSYIVKLRDNGTYMRNSNLKQSIGRLQLPYKTLKNMHILDCMGVQPMSAPVSTVGTLTYKYVDESVDDRMQLTMHETPSEARTRHLRASVSLEAIQDAKALHGIDITGEIYKILGAELSHDLEYELFHTVLNASTPIKMEDDKDFPLDYKINHVSNVIARETRRGSGNVVLVSREICSKLLGTVKGFNNVTFEGTICGNISVYSVPVAISDDEDLIIVGYSAFPREGVPYGFDSAIIYTPYLPVNFMGVVMDPVTFCPTLRLGTRGNTVVRENVGHYYKRLVL